MEQHDQQQNQAAGVPVKRMFPSEISGKFKSKADFLRYFREQCKCISSVSPCPIGQLYTPPKLMVNKDFIRQLLTEEKELIEMDRLLSVNAPFFDELSVKNLWPHIQKTPRLMRFFPDQMPKGRLPDREYMFNVLNTLEQAYCQQLIRHANDQRNSPNGLDVNFASIAISNKMEDKLKEYPFQSSKFIHA
jgi:hypothetical protein